MLNLLMYNVGYPAYLEIFGARMTVIVGKHKA